MGQAKQRGTFEQRAEQAKARNIQLAEHIKSHPQKAMFQKHIARHGIQNFATRLVAAGILVQPSR
jgi:hypothetical protein